MLDYPMKYAQFEYERRFLLSELPKDMDPQHKKRQIVDHYIKNSNLRLRKMETAVSGTFQYKFCKKIEPPEHSHLARIITNIYLTPEEFQLFIHLPAYHLTKVRYTYIKNDVRYSLDVFEKHNLILCEVEKPTLEALRSLPIPNFAIKEVTHDEKYTGSYLAQSG